MKNPVLLLGGSGVVGSRVARTLRRLQPELPLVLAGRDGAKAAAVAAEVGGPTTAIVVDLSREDLGLEPVAAFSAVVTLLKDPWLNSLKYAQGRGLAYLSFASFAFEIGPELAHYVQGPERAPILMLGHVFGGIGTLAALHFAREFLKRVESIALAGVVDPDDQGGPASQADFERLVQQFPSALIRHDGLWRWVEGQDAVREIVDVTGVKRQGQALPLLDVVSLAAATDAKSLRVDFAARESTGQGPSTELIVEIAGEGHDGERKQVRVELVDDDVYARLSAHGAALATERLLGLTGEPAPAPGLYHPESLLEPGQVLRRLQELGVRVRRVVS
ncbi:hypothetical protein [Nannocystis punicea]|uniref:Saccharopine dehydrogenase n=1 Tax=Nannocystis punicea TaxID=2995304 RepID=A0ABY7H2J1_9BACT|nr:hypothetical protein [Nannocystis poenicansa]WAS93479.1 hypothetical protein O0S08_45675 [Nannocystis poenicansa]